MNFFALNLKAFKKIALLLFVATLITGQIDQIVSSKVEAALKNPDGFTNAVYFYGFLSLTLSLLFPTFLTLICIFGLSLPTDPWGEIKKFFTQFFNQMLIETLRSWGKTLQWSLLFIVPGLHKYFLYTLVPFVVTHSKIYERGEVDALELSAQLVKKHYWKIFWWVTFFQTLIPVLIASLFDEYKILWKTPLACMALTLLETYLLLISTQCFLSVFNQSLTEKPDDLTHV